MENLIAIIGSIVAIILSLSTALKNFAEAKKNMIPKKVERQSTINVEIIEILEEMKDVFMADRVQIYDFHNGVELANRVSLMKCSCTYEVVRTGIKGHFKDLQGIHLGMIPHFIHRLLNQKELIINNLEEIKTDMPATYEFKKSQDVQAFYDILLTNKEGEPIGFIGMQYCRNAAIQIDGFMKKELYKYKGLIEEKKEEMKDKK